MNTPKDLPPELLKLASYGYKLHPLRGTEPTPKAAILEGWPEKASSDPTQLLAWHQDHPGCWWGAVCGSVERGGSGFDVIDVDDLPSWERLRDAHASAITTIEVSTPNGHHYYIPPTGHGSLSDPFSIGPNLVELRGARGYVVVPPSPGYEFLDGADPADIGNLPTWAQESIAAGKREDAREAEHLGPVPSGARHNWLRDRSIALARQGLSEAAITAALRGMARDPRVVVQGREPTPEGEIADLATSAFAKFGKDAPLALSPEDLQDILGVGVEPLPPWNSKQSPSIDDFVRALDIIGAPLKRSALSGVLLLGENRLTDHQSAALQLILHHARYPLGAAFPSALVNAASRYRSNPLLNWWESTPWNGHNHIGRLASYFHDKHGNFSTWLLRWCIGAVARVLEPTENRMLVLDGPQDMGKSYFARWLAGPMTEYYREGALTPDDKDAVLRLMDLWINEVGELGGTLRKSDRDALKFFLTQIRIRERRAYGHFDEDGFAKTSFIGTLNNDGGFLTDPTGNRRYMIASFLDIDWDYATEVDVQQVWAQALELYRSQEPWNLTPSEKTTADAVNAEYDTFDPLCDDLLRWYVFSPGDNDWVTTATDVRLVLAHEGFTRGLGKITPHRTAAALQRLGARPGRMMLDGVQQRVWFGVKARTAKNQ